MDPDQYITGERFSYFSPMAQAHVAAPNTITAEVPDATFDKAELAARLYKTIDGNEWALYAYRGYFKQPVGFDPATGRAFYPRMRAIGGSVRGTLGPGIANAEFAWHESQQDANGDNPYIPNSKGLLLMG